MQDFHISAILLMGGEGKRYGSEIPKQFLRLAGKKVYLHTLETFLSSKLFDEIILVSHPNWILEVKEDLKNDNIKIIPGGSTRQESSYLGLIACSPKTDFVVIHDAVRPFVTKETIEKNIKGAIQLGAVDTCIKSADTIVHSKDIHSKENNKIFSIPKRSEYFRGQTPQSFSYKLILNAHKNTKIKDSSDDCRLALDAGYPVHIVQGDENNIKITTELDLFLAEQLFRLRKNFSLKSTLSLKGKLFVIVGGSGGIGTCIRNFLKKEGAKVFNISRTSSNPVDLTSPPSIKKAFEKIYQDNGPIDGLINSAGILKVKPLLKFSMQEIEELISVNLTGLIYCCRFAKIKDGGHIINLASSSFSRGRKNYGIYSSTKAAVVNFTQSLAEEMPHLKVNSVIPQRTKTFMRTSNFPNENPNNLLQPEAVAKEIISLLKDDHTTGSIIEVRKS